MDSFHAVSSSSEEKVKLLGVVLLIGSVSVILSPLDFIKSSTDFGRFVKGAVTLSSNFIEKAASFTARGRPYLS